MTIWKFDIIENGKDIKTMYALTEEGGIALKKELDRDGVMYNYGSYATLYNLLTDLPEYNNEYISDKDKLNAVMKAVADMGL